MYGSSAAMDHAAAARQAKHWRISGRGARSIRTGQGIPVAGRFNISGFY
jgi:hypothetical protein